MLSSDSKSPNLQQSAVARLNLRIDVIDPAYYSVADGNGQTTTAREAGVDEGGDP
jgi:hypothetical protein